MLEFDYSGCLGAVCFFFLLAMFFLISEESIPGKTYKKLMVIDIGHPVTHQELLLRIGLIFLAHAESFYIQKV